MILFSDPLNTLKGFAQAALAESGYDNLNVQYTPFTKTQSLSQPFGGATTNQFYFPFISDTPTMPGAIPSPLDRKCYFGMIQISVSMSAWTVGTFDVLTGAATRIDSTGTAIDHYFDFGSAHRNPDPGSGTAVVVSNNSAFAYITPYPILFNYLRIRESLVAMNGTIETRAQFYGYKITGI